LQLSILLLATDRVAGEALTAALSKPGHGVTTVADPVDLFASAPGYGLVVVDQVPAPFTVAAVIEELRRDEATRPIPVLAVAQADDLEERIALLEAGADDVITKPFDQAELEARV
jgi:DNA-binding response OmpR family regulator